MAKIVDSLVEYMLAARRANADAYVSITVAVGDISQMAVD